MTVITFFYLVDIQDLIIYAIISLPTKHSCRYRCVCKAAYDNDADVTVWDNDPGYAGSVTSNATLLGTSDGTYTIVYSAPPDPAGNDAKNATRTIIISPLLEIYNVAINTTNPNPGYAKENDTLVIRLESNMSLANASVSATVFGRQADYSIYDQILYVNQTVKKGDNGHVPFTILIQDNQGGLLLEVCLFL